MRFKPWFILILLASLLLAQAAVTLAQTTADSIELVGNVEAINADGTILVNGQTVVLTTAELNVALTVGQTVKVEGTLLADGRIAARGVNSPNAANNLAEDEVEITGVVESFDGTTLVIGGITIDLSTAEINGPIVVGQVIKVHASFDAAGNLVAREAGADDNGNDDVPSPESTPEVGDDNGNDDSPNAAGEFEITGLLQEIGDGFIVVGNRTILMTQAEVKEMLQVGTMIKLHLRIQDGQLVAREVENAGDDSNQDDSSDDSSSNQNQWRYTYTVRAGDTLSAIAARTRTTVEELARVNGITDIRAIMVGMNLQVPRQVENSRGDDSRDDNSGSGSSSSGRNGSDDTQFDDHGSDDQNDDKGGNRSSDDDRDDDDNSGSNSGRSGGGDDSDDD